MPASVNDIDVRRHLAGLAFYDGRLDEFINWFVHALWAIERDAPNEDVDLAGRIENGLAAYTGGHISEDELRAGLMDDAQVFGLAPITLIRRAAPGREPQDHQPR